MTLRQRQGGGDLSSSSFSGRCNMEEAQKASILLRGRLSSPSFIFKPLCDDFPDSNYSKLKFLISSSIKEGCNNSLLLLGPRGCGKTAVLEIVLEDLLLEYPDTMTMIRLNGLLHGEDAAALKEITRQLCVDHQLSFSKMASFDDNSQFLIAMLRESGLAHKTITFVLDEFDLFTQGKQRLLYALLDAVQSVKSQAVVIGVSCRLDADQLLEKRVRSRFSHRKLLFLPPSEPEVQRLMNHALSLPMDSSILPDYATEFNTKLQDIFSDESFKEVIQTFLGCFPTVMHLKTFLFQAVSSMDLDLGYLTLKNFNSSISCFQRQPKLQALKDCSILEMYILVCMKRLEVKEQNSYSFKAVMRGESRRAFIFSETILVIEKCMNISEYKSIHDSFQMSDFYSQQVCLRAFEHLLQRGLISFIDYKGRSQSIEFRQVKLLVSSAELSHGLKSYNSCPALLHKLAS